MTIKSLRKQQEYQDLIPDIDSEFIEMMDLPRLVTFNKCYRQQARQCKWRYKTNEELAARYHHQAHAICGEDGAVIQANEFDLGGGVKILGELSDQVVNGSGLDEAFFYLSFFWREKGKFDGCDPWEKLKEFLVVLSELDTAPQIVYFRPMNVTDKPSLKHLQLFNYIPSSSTDAELRKKYRREIGGRPSGATSSGGDNFWVSDDYTELVLKKDPWPLLPEHHWFYYKTET